MLKSKKLFSYEAALGGVYRGNDVPTQRQTRSKLDVNDMTSNSHSKFPILVAVCLCSLLTGC